MSSFNLKDVYTSDELLGQILHRSDDWKTIDMNRTETLDRNGNRIDDPFAPTRLGNPCSDVPWEEFAGNKLYFDDTPIDLPKTGRWKYRLPIIYDQSKKTLKVPNETYQNVQSLKIEDRAKGGFRLNDHYFIRNNGEVWIKGSRPYLNMYLNIKWIDDAGQTNTTNVPIDADQFILNGDLISISDRKVRVPYRPCYEGFEEKYNVFNYTLTFYRKSCSPTVQGNFGAQNDLIINDAYPVFREGIFALVEVVTGNLGPTRVTSTLKPGDPGYFPGYVEVKDNFVSEFRLKHIGGQRLDEFTVAPNTFFVSSSLETKRTEVKEYRNQTRFTDLLNCECIELNIITPPTVNKFLTPNCDCTVTVSEEQYIICPDQYTEKAYSQYLAGRQSPPTIDDLIIKDDPTLLAPTYQRIITADPCEFGDKSSRVWQPFANRDIDKIVKTEVDGLFDGQESISCYATSSVQPSSSKSYYHDVTECNICEVSKSYFSVAYGHEFGSGSTFETFEDDDSASKSIFSQYKLKVLEDYADNFTYYDSGSMYTSSMIYVINFTRDSIKDRIDPGNFQISLAELNGLSYANNNYTGSNVQVSSSSNILHLIDNSGDLTEIQSCSDKNAVYSFDIVSGSLRSGIHSSGIGTADTNDNYRTYGKVYPAMGIIVLNGDLLNSDLHFNSVTGSNVNGDNSYKLFTSLSGSNALGYPLKFRNSRQRNITNYAVRIAPVECNYSNNPTYVRSDGRIKNACFIDNPVTYITAVGLYNSSRELLAIAKLSKPIKKYQDDTLDIKIRLGL